MPLPKFSLQFAFSWSVYFSNRTELYLIFGRSRPWSARNNYIGGVAANLLLRTESHCTLLNYRVRVTVPGELMRARRPVPDSVFTFIRILGVKSYFLNFLHFGPNLDQYAYDSLNFPCQAVFCQMCCKKNTSKYEYFMASCAVRVRASSAHPRRLQGAYPILHSHVYHDCHGNRHIFLAFRVDF